MLILHPTSSMAYITMTPKELNRYYILRRLVRKELTNAHAAELLHLSPRHVKRLKKRLQEFGTSGLIHASRGKPSNHRLTQRERDRIATILTKHYSDFKPTFATEKLRERHQIDYDPKTIRGIMIEEHLWTPKKARTGTNHRSWRQRRSSMGEMQQFDGSYEYWFEDRAPKCCLLAAIDDATGHITKAQFDLHEGVVPVFTFWKEYLQILGKPLNIYMDKFSTYKMPQRWVEQNHDLKTQFQRALMDMRIEPIFAHSPQAKGRVERLFETLQDRLIKELRLEHISTMEAANRFLQETFIPRFNRQFGVEPALKTDLHRVLTPKERKNLDSTFSRQYERTIHNDFTLSFNNTWYQLIKEQPATVCKKDVVMVEEHLDGSVHIRLRGKELNTKILPHRPHRATKQPWVLPATTSDPRRPAADHPWRRYAVSTVTQTNSG